MEGENKTTDIKVTCQYEKILVLRFFPDTLTQTTVQG